MSKLIKYIGFFFIPILAFLLILLFFSTLALDYKYAHKSLVTFQKPFDWSTYKFEISLIKFIKKLKNNKKIGLNRKKIYISEKSQKSLLSNVPMSTKIWQQGFFLMENNELKKIKIRYRGDNPRNWLFKKKNLRIKTRKKSQIGQYRYYDYDPYNFQKFISGKIANKIGVISPKYELIELYINDNSEGIYIQTEKINENFLRRNKLMPVNIYKGEQINSEALIKTDSDLFNNHAIWKKIAIFNKVEENDKSDLIYFINLLRKSETDDFAYKKLMSTLDLSEWGKFAAYQILTNNYHNDYSHNMRIILDPWSGKLRPIIVDPILGDNIFDKNKIGLNNSSHGLLLFLNKNSSFIDKKYNELFDLISTRNIIQKQIDELKNFEKQISISEHRDVEVQRNIFNNLSFIEKINPSKIFNLSESTIRASVKENLLAYNARIIKKFFSIPKSSWSFFDSKINININDDIPISNIKIFFNKKIPEWISVDLNGDKIFNDNEKFFSNEIGVFSIPLNLYSNRIVVARDKSELAQPKIIISNTRFEFKVESSVKPYKIQAQNPFSKEIFDLNIDNSPSLSAHKFNLPIIKKTMIKEEPKIIKGTIKVHKDLIFKKKIIIKPGTKFLIAKNVNIIFLNAVQALGTKDKPIIFQKMNDLYLDNNWGSIVVQGQKTKNSKFLNLIINGGSGGKVDHFIYTSMFSLHDTRDIVLKNISLINNKKYDDALHLVYCKNILLENILIENAFSDALDIDISDEIFIKNSIFLNPNNDSIDIMESTVLIDSTEIFNSGDKGISVGENSNVIVHNSHLYSNKIGIAVKDNSIAKVVHTDFNNNIIQIGSYQKNYKYGNGGKINIFKSNFNSETNKIESDMKSNIIIDDSTFNKKMNIKNSNIKLTKKINYAGNKITTNILNLNTIDLMLSNVDVVKNKNLRGSDFINK